MTHKEVEEYILSKPGAWLDYPFGEDAAVYKVGGKSKNSPETGKMFALIAEGKSPVRVSLKCDPLLAKTLRERYESVLPGYHLNKTHWNTIILSGQLGSEDILGFIDHSYQLVCEGLSSQTRQSLGL